MSKKLISLYIETKEPDRNGLFVVIEKTNDGLDVYIDEPHIFFGKVSINNNTITTNNSEICIDKDNDGFYGTINVDGRSLKLFINKELGV